MSPIHAQSIHRNPCTGFSILANSARARSKHPCIFAAFRYLRGLLCRSKAPAAKSDCTTLPSTESLRIHNAVAPRPPHVPIWLAKLFPCPHETNLSETATAPKPTSARSKPLRQRPHLPDRHHVLHLPRLSRHGAPAFDVHQNRPSHGRHLRLRQHAAQTARRFFSAYLAAVFDVAAKTFRDTQAEAITKVRKFDIKTQTFTEIEYKGYKANRCRDARGSGAADSLHSPRARGLPHSDPRTRRLRSRRRHRHARPQSRRRIHPSTSSPATKT